MNRGQLRVYLGAAAGVGKTFAMLGEGRRRAERGTDVVVGVVETHGRPRTAEQIGDLEVVPRHVHVHRDRSFPEMDVDAVLARRPEVALVDELAHTNVPGSRNPKRWQDVDELLAAGIDVVSTVNIQHLESLNDVVESITGIVQRETIPDAVVRAAEQIELVDMTPEALRRRLAHGNVFPAERVDTALANYFRPGNLAALRELALMWLADRVDDGLREYRTQHGIEEPWETRERVVVGLTGAPTGGHLIRRAARVAARRSADLVGVHVRAVDGLAGPAPRALPDQRRLLDDLGGTYHEIAGDDPARALVEFARAHNATQLVLGASRRNRWQELVRGSVISAVLRSAGGVDVHVISTADTGPGPDPDGLRPLDDATDDGDRGGDGDGDAEARTADGRADPTPLGAAHDRTHMDALARFARGPFSARRAGAAWTVALGGPVGATVVLDRLRDHLGLPSVLLVYLLAAVLAASAGGWAPGLFAALTSFLLANFFFTQPVHTFTIDQFENVLALTIFLVVAGLVSLFVAQAARRSSEAARARAQAETLVSMAGTIATDDDPFRELVGLLRSRYAAGAVAVLHRHDDGWGCEASSGSPVPVRPDDADVVVPLDDASVLVFDGLAVDDATLEALQTFGQHLSLAVDRRRLRADAAQARRTAEANELRGALLAAVSHDLRTPLASVKASVSSLRQPDVDWQPDQRDEFLAAIEDGVDQLGELIANLLGMSRIQAGAVELARREVGLDEIVPAALVGLDTRGVDVDIDVDETLPRVCADAALLERAVANLIDNACKWSPPGGRVSVRADAHAGLLGLLVVDRGPGVPLSQREAIFQPFQRLGDGGPGTVSGTGLGLAVAQGFVRLMGGEIRVEDTPGGGATMVLTLPEAP